MHSVICHDFKIKVITFIRYTADFPMQLEWAIAIWMVTESRWRTVCCF